MAEAIQLLVATVFLRFYIFAFLAFYLTTAAVAIERRWTALFAEIAWVVAFSPEYSSTWMAFARYRQSGMAYSFVAPGVLS